VFEHFAECRDKGLGIHRVQGVEREGGHRPAERLLWVPK
jgi:hypothetical protein